MGVSIGFSQILSSVVELFGFIYTTGYMIFEWLSTPLIETVGDTSAFLGDFAAYTPFELIFGPGLLLILILCMVKFVIPT